MSHSAPRWQPTPNSDSQWQSAPNADSQWQSAPYSDPRWQSTPNPDPQWQSMPNPDSQWQSDPQNPYGFDAPSWGYPGQSTDPHYNKTKRKDSSSLILVVRTVVITVLVLAVLGAGVFFYLKMQAGDNSPSGSGQTQMQGTQATTNFTVPVSPTIVPAVTTTPPEPTQHTLPEGHYYYSCYNPYTEFVLLYSDSQYYSPADLRDLSDKELEVALAEIDARHGGMPDNSLLAEYFSYLSWFTPSSTPYELSFVESANAMLIRTLQKKRSGTLTTSPNPYMPYFDANDYFMPEASTRYLTSWDLKDLSRSELVLIRNEIFARHGYIFDLNELLEYFYATNWYVPTYIPEEFTYNYFSRVEEENVGLVVVYEDLLDYTGPRSDNPYIQYLGYSEFILPYSDTVRLQESDLEGLDKNQLLLAEEEIYARHGLAYQNVHLFHYFLECSWYTPEIAPGYSSRIQFSAIEQANLALIKAYRKNH